MKYASFDITSGMIPKKKLSGIGNDPRPHPHARTL